MSLICAVIRITGLFFDQLDDPGLFFLREIKAEGMVKSVPDFRVFVDSPLAVEATNIFLQTPPEYFAEEVREILLAKDRTRAPETAPARGLFLMKVFYDRSELENYQPEGVPFWS